MTQGVIRRSSFMFCLRACIASELQIVFLPEGLQKTIFPDVLAAGRFARIGIPFPDPAGRMVEWQLPRYNTIHRLLTNPIYAGAYVYGRTGSKIRVGSWSQTDYAQRSPATAGMGGTDS